MPGPREVQLVEQIEQARAQQQQQAIIEAAQAQASQKLSDLGFKSAADSAIRKAKLGDAKEDAERKAQQQATEGGGGLDIQKATSAFNGADLLRDGQGPSKPVAFTTTADARGGAGAQRALGQLRGGGQGRQGSQGSQGGFNVPETITELQTKSGVESFQTPNAILRAPTSEATFTTRQNALTPGQALTARVGEERNRLAQEKQRLDQLQEQVEFDGESGAGLLSQQRRGGLPEGTFEKWKEAIAQSKGKEYADKVGRQALFQNLQDEADFDRQVTLREISGRTDVSRDLEEIEARIADGDFVGANRLAALATRGRDVHMEVSPDGKAIISTGPGSNVQAKIRNNRNLFGAKETVRVLELLIDAVEERRDLAGVPGQFGRAAIRLGGIVNEVGAAFKSLNRTGELTELRDVLRLQFDIDVKAGLVPEFIREAVRDARQISELRSLTTLVTYIMVRDLKEGRPSDRDFRILNSDLAGFTTAKEVLGDLDGKLNLFRPRVRFYEDQVDLLKRQTNPLDFESIIEDQRAAKVKSKRNEFEITEDGVLKRVE